MTDQKKIAAFLAAKGATRIAPDVQTLTHRELWEAVRGERRTARRIDITKHPLHALETAQA